MDEDIYDVLAMEEARESALAKPISESRKCVQEKPELESEEKPCKAWAFKLGRYARYGDISARTKFESVTSGLPLQNKAELSESFAAGLRKGRDPDLLKKAAKVLARLEQDGPIETQTKLGRSRHYPRLLMMAYIIGHDGKPFMFAKHKIAEALGVPSVSVQNFILLAHRWGLFDTVRPGVPRLHGSPAWYHLWVDSVCEELGLGANKIKRILDLLKVA